MSTINLTGAALGNALQEILMCQDIQPGDPVGYQAAKTIYAYHPLGGKLVDSPIEIAQSQQRDIVAGPEGVRERLVEAFVAEWQAIGADEQIANCARLARIYGEGSIALVSEGTPPDRPVDFKGLADAQIAFNALDPLNTAGSLVLNQNPNAMDFQKVRSIAVAGQAYHRSRTVTLLNERPLYIEYTNSAFGFSGRSVYQRALFPLKSFINTQVANDMVARKAGVLVAKMAQQSSAIDRMMANISGLKRELLKEAENNNVLSIGSDESIESLDLKNLEAPLTASRRNIIMDIASSSGTPAKLILEETFAEGFGEGTEDAKHIAKYIARIRDWMGPLYAYFDKIVRHRAWNAEFYKTIQAEFQDRYGKIGYTQAFYDWSNDFKATWPNLLEEPDSEKVKVAEIKLKSAIAVMQVLGPIVDPDNRARLVGWLTDQLNQEQSFLFATSLDLDIEALATYTPPEPMPEIKKADPRVSFSDSLPRIGRAVPA